MPRQRQTSLSIRFPCWTIELPRDFFPYTVCLCTAVWRCFTRRQTVISLCCHCDCIPELFIIIYCIYQTCNSSLVSLLMVVWLIFSITSQWLLNPNLHFTQNAFIRRSQVHLVWWAIVRKLNVNFSLTVSTFYCSIKLFFVLHLLTSGPQILAWDILLDIIDLLFSVKAAGDALK